MSRHRIHIELATAEHLLDLPEGTDIVGALTTRNSLVVIVDSKKDLGQHDLGTLYGLDEEKDAFVLGMLEPVGPSS